MLEFADYQEPIVSLFRGQASANAYGLIVAIICAAIFVSPMTIISVHGVTLGFK